MKFFGSKFALKSVATGDSCTQVCWQMLLMDFISLANATDRYEPDLWSLLTSVPPPQTLRLPRKKNDCNYAGVAGGERHRGKERESAGGIISVIRCVFSSLLPIE